MQRRSWFWREASERRLVLVGLVPSTLPIAPTGYRARRIQIGSVKLGTWLGVAAWIIIAGWIILLLLLAGATLFHIT
jgi:hypothetical protein